MLETTYELNLIVSTGFEERVEHLITYKNGGKSSPIDYIVEGEVKAVKLSIAK